MSGLLGSPILEVAIGLFFIYFLLSLICSHVSEIMAGLLKLRARDLEQGIANLLCDPDLTEKVQTNPLIKALGNTLAETIAVERMAGGEKNPIRRIYVRARNGVIVVTRFGRTFWQKVVDRLRAIALWVFGFRGKRERQADYAGKPSYIPARTFATALFDSLAPTAAGPLTVDRLRRQALGLINGISDDLKMLVQKYAASPNLSAAIGSLWTLDRIRETIQDTSKITDAEALIKLVDERQAAVNAIESEFQRLFADSPDRLRLLAALSLTTDTLKRLRTVAQNAPADKLRQAALDVIEGKQAIGRALLSMIDQSGATRVISVTVDDVKQMVEQLVSSPAMQQRVVAGIGGIVRQLVGTPGSGGDQQLKNAVSMAQTIDEIRKNIMILPESPARAAVLAFIDKGQADLEAVRTSVETWYDNAMDRVSGVYKRRLQVALLMISFAVCCGIGADTLKIGTMLLRNADLRASLANEAARTTAPGGAFALPGATGAMSTTTTVNVAATGTMTTTTVTTAISNTSVLLNELEQFSQLLGYNDVRPLLDEKNQCRQAASWWQYGACWWTLDWWNGVGWLFWKILGLAVTTFAVSLGAPFWFDLLQKVSNIRAAGKPPERSEPEAKDKDKGST